MQEGDTDVTGQRTQRFAAWRWAVDEPSTRADHVVVEEPLTVHLEQAGTRLVLGSTMRTPGDDLELAIGLAVGEGIVGCDADIEAVMHCLGIGGATRNDVLVRVRPHVDLSGVRPDRITRPTSACGICGRDEIEQLISRAYRVTSSTPPPPEVICDLPAAMVARQRVFQRTGGLHAAALADERGHLMCVREDVGRHNAVDKVIGYALTSGLAPAVLVVSGRAGFEIVQKAVMAGIPALASVSAATNLAVAAARAAGLTLACFVRDGQMTVYHAPHWQGPMVAGW